MCLNTIQIYPEVAKKDITCYMVAIEMEKGELISYYRGVPITPKMSAKVKKRTVKDFPWSNVRTVSKGLHSFATLDSIRLHRRVGTFRTEGAVIIKCIIPKGTKFYTGTFLHRKSYCSEQRNIVKIY